MHLRSLTLKGFKSFPERTRLDFGPGVSVVVGPNGSGKSNVTDAVLWAMGEQSPLAIRGQSMQDVIFGGGRGVQPRNAAEVEIVLDNSDGTVDLPLSEISIVRRLDRNGEGGYTLNGARCRLVDVIEVLSDTGLGKETHSVISQGRVDAIVTSKPRDRRLLIEEAAGLGKHRKRRRRAQLKLERTQENLDRALDIEREARTRLRPLKRQAEAAELHERLERQILQARLALARELVRIRDGELDGAETAVAAARAERERVDGELQRVVGQRGLAERALAERGREHEALTRRLYGARGARERLALRGEQAQQAAGALQRRRERAEQELQVLGEQAAADPGPAAGALVGRLQELEAELARIDAEREQEIARETSELERERAGSEQRLAEAGEGARACEQERTAAEERVASVRAALATAERDLQHARRESERVGAELAGVNQFLRAHARFGAESEGAPRALSELLSVREGYELALAAALGGRLDAALVEDVPGAQALLDGAGPDGGAALLASGAAPAQRSPGAAPAPGATRLTDLLSGPPEVLRAAGRLLADAWVIDRLEDLPADFQGTATTPAGRVWFAAAGELRQLAAGGSERVLARRNERERLLGEADGAAAREHAARGAREQASAALAAAEAEAARAGESERAAERERVEAAEALRRCQWLISERRRAPAQGALAVRRAEVEGELAAERRMAAERERERERRGLRSDQLTAQIRADGAALPAAQRLVHAITGAGEAVAAVVAAIEAETARDREAGEAMAAELRRCAGAEAEIQSQLRSCGEAVTGAEVAAQRVRDQAQEARAELSGVIAALELDAEQLAAEEAAPLGSQEREELSSRVVRLTRRREQLGPVNPLAKQEHAEALAYVEELEGQRGDLEVALRELRGVIREADRQIAETFEATFAAAARNFEELVGDVFPGGSGRLRLVEEERAPRAVLGGQQLAEGEGSEAVEAAAEAEEDALEAPDADEPGVEIEVTPAGKSTKRLSLLSGGEKSMTALAFLFAVFLARPCPFYILDEVEAALDDLNLDRFLALLRRYSDRAQFIVITHQKRTMEAADWLFGVSMGSDGISKVLSRRLPPQAAPDDVPRAA